MAGFENQIGVGVESSYGDFATPTRFVEFNSESLAPDKQVLRSRSSGDRFMRTGRSRHYIRGGGGQIEIPFMNQGMGLFLKHAIGDIDTQQVGITAEYTHTATPGDTGGVGNSLTIQKGLSDVGDVVEPFNFLGGKVIGWELVQELDANLLLRLTFDAMTVETDSALATATYPAELVPLSFIDATLTIDDDEICVRSFTVAGNPGLDVNRRCLGNTKKEPIPSAEYEVTGQITREFESLDQYAAWIEGTPASLVATWAYGEIGATGNPFKLVVTIPVLEYTGEMPTANGSEIVMQNLPFKALFNGTDAIVTMEYSTSDTTP